MKYLRTFENFEAHAEEELKPTAFDMELDAEEDEYQDEYAQDEDEEEAWEEENKPEEEVEEVTLEKKKLPAGLKAYLDKKKKGGAATKGKAKPDFLDLDKDGDKKESMKKAAKEAKAKKK
jgi:hypothetical protein